MSTPLVTVMMGSPRDFPIMKAGTELLERLGVPFEVFVSSAHKTPDRTHGYIVELANRGVEVVIGGAGAAAHLAGVVAASFPGPVIAVPIAATELHGADALLAMVQMPSGVPVATVAIDQPGAKNAAILAAQMLAKKHPAIASALSELQAKEHRPVDSSGPASSKGPKVAVVCASETDRPFMERTTAILEQLDISFEFTIKSPVRDPEGTRNYARGLVERGVEVIIGGAGASGYLCGALAAYVHLPVISVPLPTTQLAGLDSLLASVQMPSGTPVATVAIGPMGAKNSALLAAQVLAITDTDLGSRLAEHRRMIGQTLIKEADALMETLPPEQRGKP